jgi:DNA-binding SARP family transcriptional activator
VVEVRVLGPLEAVVDGVPVSLGPPQQRALVALLALQANAVVSRDRIVDELWGERPPATVAKLVQGYVSALRKVLAPGVVVTRSPGYLLRLGPGALDLERFERLAAEGRSALADGRAAEAAGRLREALALWRGPALGDLGAVPFAQGEAARLEELRLAALCDRLEADLSLDVAAELDALVAEHPLHERLRGQHMLALYRAGRQAEALAAYQAARRALVDELGIEPGRELRELQEAILRQDEKLDVAPAAAPAAAPGPGAFVGREAELGALDDALVDALAGSGRLVLVGGEPGIGKSRLAEELGRRARARGARVCVGRCWEAGGAPAYWPWVQALRAYLRAAGDGALRARLDRDAGELATLLPELRDLGPAPPASPPPAAEGAQFRLMESVAGFLRGAAADVPLVVGLDDLHAADAPSLLLLRFVAAQLPGVPLLIVGCYRDTEVDPDLAATLGDLAREPALRRIALRGLGDAETSRLLGLAMGATPADDLAADVHAETQGNPLFAQEIGRLLAAEGTAAPGRLPIPRGVVEAIGRRLQRQSEGCRDVLALASVVGREFDPAVIGMVGALDEDTVVDALDEAAQAGLVGAVPEATGRLRFSHILVRDALYEELPAPRRPRLHRDVAEALERLYAANPEPHLTELAQHYREAGPAAAGKAIAYAQRAADRAAAQFAYEEAAQGYGSALALLETAPAGDADRERELLLARGEALGLAGRGAEARGALRRAADLAEDAGRPDQLARAALAYGGRLGWERASVDPFYVPMLERGLAAVGSEDSPERVRLLARVAAARRDDPLRDRRLVAAAEAVAIAERIGDPGLLAVALEGQWIAIEGPDELATGAGISASEQMIALGRQVGDRELVFAGHDHRLHFFWILGDRPAVEVELDALTALADDLRQPARHWHVGTGRTMLALMEGRFADAEELIAQTARLGRHAQSWNAAVSERIAGFVLHREQGRLAERAAGLRRSVHEYPALLRFRCAVAHLDAELGREAEARAALRDILALDLERQYRDAEWLFGLTVLCRPAATVGGAAEAERLYALLSPFAQLYAVAPVEGVFGAVATGLGALATALGRHDDAVRHLDAAIDLERRMGAPPWLAHARHELAGALLARGGAGDRERAVAERDETVASYRALGMDAWAARAAALG